jgi:hypothetical protein
MAKNSRNTQPDRGGFHLLVQGFQAHVLETDVHCKALMELQGQNTLGQGRRAVVEEVGRVACSSGGEPAGVRLRLSAADRRALD